MQLDTVCVVSLACKTKPWELKERSQMSEGCLNADAAVM